MRGKKIIYVVILTTIFLVAGCKKTNGTSEDKIIEPPQNGFIKHETEDEKIKINGKVPRIFRNKLRYTSIIDEFNKEYEEYICANKSIQLDYQIFNKPPYYEEFKKGVKAADGLIIEMLDEDYIGGKARIKNIPIIETLEMDISIHNEEHKKKYFLNSDTDAIFYYDYYLMGDMLCDLVCKENNVGGKKSVLIIGGYDYSKSGSNLVEYDDIFEFKKRVNEEPFYEVSKEIEYTDRLPAEKFGSEDILKVKQQLKENKNVDVIVIGRGGLDTKQILDMLKEIGFSLRDKQKIYVLTDLLSGGEETLELVAKGEIDACICTDISSQIEGAYDAMFKLLKGEEVPKMNPAKFQVITKENAKDYRNLPCYKMFQELGCDSTGKGREWD
ncbi:MAG: hypothetical protein K6G65_08080 [Lachnospiraceae bacterium]|nr:hypothetical protein [Lachnospiraceae bacterium]